jgi:hypothetical protein
MIAAIRSRSSSSRRSASRPTCTAIGWSRGSLYVSPPAHDALISIEVTHLATIRPESEDAAGTHGRGLFIVRDLQTVWVTATDPEGARRHGRPLFRHTAPNS